MMEELAMKGYQCLQINEYRYEEYSLVAIREQDIMLIKEWRNAQIAILRQKELLNDEGQRRYFKQVIWPSFELDKPEQLLFSFLKNNELIGYGGIVHTNWIDKRGEVSFLVDPIRANDPAIYHQDYLTYLRLLKQVAYLGLQFNRLFAETFDIRPRHIGILEEAGFRLEGRMKQHVYIDGRFVDSLIHGHLKEYDGDVDQ
jgi:RimJ/RimL family protein N-acetyltransferase